MDKNSSIGLLIVFLVLSFLFWESAEKKSATPTVDRSKKQLFSANYGTPLLDGKADDEVWQQTEWNAIDQTWIGAQPGPDDFSGRYKTCWDENNLYVLAEILDDTLIDIHPDGLLKYWDDDCLEVFIDADASGGNHQYNYNAFAYHIALDGKVVDIRPDSAFAYFNEHCTSRRLTIGKTSTWELAIKIYDGNRYEDGGDNIPQMLKAGKEMGFAVAYCDNDNSPERENFMGSVVVGGTDKNQGWIDAGIFGLLNLK